MSDSPQNSDTHSDEDRKNGLHGAGSINLDEGDLGKIQSLLFGSQLTAIVERLERLEARMDQRLAEQHHDLITKLGDFNTQQRDDNDAAKLEIDQLRKHLLSAEDSQENAYTELMSLIEELRKKKLDRASLAGLLGNVAEQIDSE